jgi:hypothetical protein
MQTSGKYFWYGVIQFFGTFAVGIVINAIYGETKNDPIESPFFMGTMLILMFSSPLWFIVAIFTQSETPAELPIPKPIRWVEHRRVTMIDGVIKDIFYPGGEYPIRDEGIIYYYGYQVSYEFVNYFKSSATDFKELMQESADNPWKK